jgi:hypothetical protein
MSNFYALAREKNTDHKFLKVTMVDNYFGGHKYGVKFPNGFVLKAEDCDILDINSKI